VGTYLDEILDFHRHESRGDTRSLDALIEKAGEVKPPRGFNKALMSSPVNEMAVIAEIKKRSPSLGELVSDLIPSFVSQEYEKGGASALSVLTNNQYFGGSSMDLREARAACSLPILRKDFTVDLRDVCDTRIMEADAVLLIAAALDDHELKDFIALANELEIDALVEVHDEDEVERALVVGAQIIGVNQRDLQTFEVDTDRAVRIGKLLPSGVTKVAESGINSPEDIPKLHAASYRAVLVGEYLVQSENRAERVTGLRTAADR
tara:strand:+ start:1557 stop:2348 length:792 start_codon:yes stop_codon:yes gene_type:complete